MSSVVPLSIGLILLRLVYLPRARGKRWKRGAGGGFGSIGAHLTPHISLTFFTLYWFGRHGSFVLPWNMTSASFLFFSPLK